MMIVIAILLFIVGIVGFFVSMMMFGDIAVAGMIGSVTAILASIGFWICNKRMNQTYPKEDKRVSS